jgi:predicted nucleic acid-binding protein
VGELLAFSARAGHGPERIEALEKRLNELVVVEINRPIADRYAEFLQVLEKKGKPIGANDTWIAAAAIESKATVWTCDKDFEKVPARILRRRIFEPDQRGKSKKRIS